MKSIVIANQKGGVGKTAIAVHLAYGFEKNGLNTVLIDLDTQGNASFTLKQYKNSISASKLFQANTVIQLNNDNRLNLITSDVGLVDIQSLSIEELIRNFQNSLKQLESLGIDVVVIDTAPTLSNLMAAAIGVVDAVISPIEVEMYSMQGIEKTLTLIQNIQKVNKKVQFLGMLPSRYNSRTNRHRDNLEQLKTAYGSLVCDFKITERNAISQSLADCVPVWKIKKTAARPAAKEMQEMVKYVHEKMFNLGV